MKKVLAIVGPTAVGKSALAMHVASELEAEIVSLDSATVYRGMDIGTDKPTAADRDAVVHHMLDLVAPDEVFTVAEFQQQAREAMFKVEAWDRTPLLVGGSGLYFRAVVDPLVLPGTDPELRRRLEAELKETGPEEMYNRLVEIDPKAAARIHPSNARRTVRALEVAELTGRLFSSFRTAWEARESIYDLAVAGLRLPLEEMDTRIDRRVDRLVERGWVDEVERLGKLSATSARVLGYAQIAGFLAGSSTLDEAIDVIKLRTRQFARRQLRWFKADPRIRWFEDPAEAAEFLMKEAR